MPGKKIACPYCLQRSMETMRYSDPAEQLVEHCDETEYVKVPKELFLNAMNRCVDDDFKARMAACLDEYPPT